jgi:tetratricopeptide (TPR) repeat protein
MADLAHEYRRLLTRDETAESVDTALALIERALNWKKLHNADRLHLQQALHGQIAPPRPESGRENRLARVCEALSSFASELHERKDSVPDERFSLLVDLLLITFHHAYFGLLPRLSHGENRVRLLNSFQQFAAVLRKPADRFHVLGMVELARGKTARAEEDFKAALAATHTDDHEFMSRLQLLWTLLLERSDYDSAFRLIQEQIPRVTRQDLQETQSLLDETYSAARSQGNGHGQKRQKAKISRVA